MLIACICGLRHCAGVTILRANEITGSEMWGCCESLGSFQMQLHSWGVPISVSSKEEFSAPATAVTLNVKENPHLGSMRHLLLLTRIAGIKSKSGYIFTSANGLEKSCRNYGITHNENQISCSAFLNGIKHCVRLITSSECKIDLHSLRSMACTLATFETGEL